MKTHDEKNGNAPVRVLISGYYGFGNAGDELILESLLAGLRSSPANAEITVLSARPEETSRVHGVHAVNRWNLSAVILSLRRTDIFISGGGGLFQDSTGSFSLYYYLAAVVLAGLLGKKIFIYGVGVTDLRGINRFLTARVLGLARRITVREADSFRLLTAWGCQPEKIEVTADAVLLREVPPPLARNRIPLIAYILRSPHRCRPATISAFARLADALAERLGAANLFIPFQTEQDLPFMRSVAAAMRVPPEIVQWKRSGELCGNLARADIVISQRFHGLVLSALYVIPFVGISDDPKIIRFVRESGQVHIGGAELPHLERLLPAVTGVWERRESLAADLRSLLPLYRARAQKMNELLLQEL